MRETIRGEIRRVVIESPTTASPKPENPASSNRSWDSRRPATRFSPRTRRSSATSTLRRRSSWKGRRRWSAGSFPPPLHQGEQPAGGTVALAGVGPSPAPTEKTSIRLCAATLVACWKRWGTGPWPPTVSGLAATGRSHCGNRLHLSERHAAYAAGSVPSASTTDSLPSGGSPPSGEYRHRPGPSPHPAHRTRSPPQLPLVP